MRKKIMKLCVALSILCSVVFFANTNVQAKTQNYSIKGTTLTITGNISKKTKFKKTGKITKIVVSKKVKNLPAEPFKKLKKVKTLRIPGSCYSYFCSNTIDTVIFTTPIKSRLFYKNFKTKKYIVSKKDKKYKSIKGNVYTKGGKKFIAMPSETKNLKIREGCKTVSFKGIAYYPLITKPKNYAATAIRNITIPKSVVKFEYPDLEQYSFDEFKYSDKINISFKNKNIDEIELNGLYLFLGLDTFKRMFKNQVRVEGDFVIYNENLFVAYTGCDEVVSIPEGITRANPHALEHSIVDFYGYKKINYPSTFKDPQNKLIVSSSIDGYKYNEFEINLDENVELKCAYCKHQQEKLVKVNIKKAGVLTYCYKYDTKPYKIYDSNKEEVKQICYDEDYKAYIAVNKGDVLYIQIPKWDNQTSEWYKEQGLIAQIWDLKIITNNEVLMKNITGANETQYIELEGNDKR